MRIHMQDALASLLELDKGHLATAANAATHPIPSLPDALSPSPEPPLPPEHESVIWLRATIAADRALDSALIRTAEARKIGVKAHDPITRHDPQDAIARCDAELKLLDLHCPNHYGYCLTCDPDSCGCVGSGDYPCATVRTILAGYRHREGFSPEWVSA